MNKSWDGKVPDWELEPIEAEQKENMETSVEAEPSVAEKRLEELTAEVKEVAPENLEQKSAQVETMRAEIAAMAKPEHKPAALESVKAEALSFQPINMEEIHPSIPEVNSGYGRRPFVNPASFEGEAVKEASGGLIEYVPSSKQNKFGYEFEGSGKIPPEKLENLKANLEVAEREKYQEMFSYLKVPEKSFGAEWRNDLKLNDAHTFEGALDAKVMHNSDVRKKIFFTGVGCAGVTALGSVGAMIAAGPGTAGAIAALTVGGIAAPAILGIGALGWIGKKIYDSYKEKKAVKNFMIASVAQNVRHSLKNTP